MRRTPPGEEGHPTKRDCLAAGPRRPLLRYAATFSSRWITRRFAGTGPSEKRDQERPGVRRHRCCRGVDRDAVRRGELARRDAGMRLAEPCQQFVVLCRVDADARADIRPVAVDRPRRPALADIAQRVRPVPEAHPIGPMQVVPLRLPVSVAVEDLHAMVLAVSDIDPAVRINTDIVRDIELARIGAGFAPGHRAICRPG